MSTLMQDQDWYQQARCAEIGGDEFFPEKGGSTRHAKAVCNGDPATGRPPCPVRAQCLEWALTNEERFGIFGGHSERERRKMSKPTVEIAATGTDVTMPLPAAVATAQEPTPRNYGLPYIGGANGGGHYPLPDPARPVHIEQRGKPKSSIDWDKIRADNEARRRAEGTLDQQPAAAPSLVRCRWCRAPQLEPLVDDLCQPCRDDAVAQFHAPDDTALGQELGLLAVSDPDVAAAAASYDDMVGRVTRPEDHIQAPSDEVAKEEAPEPPTEGKQGKPTTPRSARRATQASSTTGRAPVAGPSTTREKNPAATQETRPDVAAGLNQLIDDLAQIRATVATELARVELALDQVLSALHGGGSPVEQPADTATGATDSQKPRRRRPGSGPKGDEADIIRLYTEQQMTSGEIALQLHTTPKRVRAVLDRAGIERRDDRKTHSGGKPKDYPEQLVADVRRLYLEQQLTQAEVAKQLDTTVKVVQSVMARHNIPARPSASASSKAGHGHPIKLDDTKVDQLVERYEAGESAAALARAFSVSLPSVLHRLRQRGVQIRGRGGNHRKAS